MSEKIYFQWQNDFLRKTIYPLREMKLRHFLLYYKEIDLWEQSKDRKIEDLPEEVAEFVATQNRAITDAVNHQKSLRTYFLNTEKDYDPQEKDERLLEFTKLRQRIRDVVNNDVPKNVPKAEIQRYGNLLEGLHNTFLDYFPKEANKKDEKSQDRKENIFIAMRIADWEPHYKQLKQIITRKRNLLAGVHKENLEARTKEVEALEEIVLPGIKNELEQLNEFLSAHTKLEKRKEEFDKWQEESKKKQDKIPARLDQIEKEIGLLAEEKTRKNHQIARLTAAQNLGEFLRQWSRVNIYDEIRQAFTRGRFPVQSFVLDIVVETIGAAIENAGGGFYKELGLKTQQWTEQGREQPEQISDWVRDQAAKLKQAQKELVAQTAALEAQAETMPVGSPIRMNQKLASNILAGPALKLILVRETEKLDDLLAAISYSRDKPERLKGKLSKEQASLADTEKQLQKKTDEALQLTSELVAAKVVLHVPREKYLSEFVPDEEISIKRHIVPFRAQKEYARLEKLNHDQLLREVYDRFSKEPERFPLWLQYMVVHFSGMRYASAHGSWADPRDMLLSLRMLEIQETHKVKTADSIQSDCEVKMAIYEQVDTGTKGGRSGAVLRALARAAAVPGPEDDKKPNPVRQRIEEYYRPRLSPGSSLDTQRKALLDLEIEEESYEIQDMAQEEVLEGLRKFKDEIPAQMWNEIVKLTDLRLTEVNSQDWETLKPQEQDKRLASLDSKMGKYREIMNQWKTENLTGWREEHERSNRLIVTRAVCNEVAEHIQHLRGHVGAAGLAQKPFWYKGEETKFYETKPRPPGQPPYFVRAKDKNDFEIGASILWLRFVHEVPNEWRIARPIETRKGEGLISKGYLGRKRESGGWIYDLNKPVSRTRHKITSRKKGAKPGGKESQWLRWMHEATVAAVEETAEGTVVLTFETALPYEDPSMSTVGVFKRYLNQLTSDLGEDGYNPAFVGFVPERALPANELKDLEAMLDWNHILLEEVLSPAKLEAYRQKYIRNWKPRTPTIQIVDEEAAEAKKGKAHLPICDFVKWTDELASQNENLYKVRIWGDPRLVGLNVQTVGMGNFQAVGLYNLETGRGAVSNFLKILREEIDHLMAMQIEDEFVAKRTGKGDWRKQKMDWLCKGEGTIFFTKGGKGWQTAKSILWGTVALGGNLVQVEGKEEIEFKIGRQKEKMWMARLAGFRKWDWNQPLDDLLAQGLVHRCFCASNRGKIKNKPVDTPKGIIYSPFLSALDWDFAGREQPRAFYLPMDQLVKPDEKDYDGIAKRLNCGA